MLDEVTHNDKEEIEGHYVHESLYSLYYVVTPKERAVADTIAGLLDYQILKDLSNMSQSERSAAIKSGGDLERAYDDANDGLQELADVLVDADVDSFLDRLSAIRQADRISHLNDNIHGRFHKGDSVIERDSHGIWQVVYDGNSTSLGDQPQQISARNIVTGLEGKYNTEQLGNNFYIRESGGRATVLTASSIENKRFLTFNTPLTGTDGTVSIFEEYKFPLQTIHHNYDDDENTFWGEEDDPPLVAHSSTRLNGNVLLSQPVVLQGTWSFLQSESDGPETYSTYTNGKNMLHELEDGTMSLILENIGYFQSQEEFRFTDLRTHNANLHFFSVLPNKSGFVRNDAEPQIIIIKLEVSEESMPLILTKNGNDTITNITVGNDSLVVEKNSDALNSDALLGLVLNIFTVSSNDREMLNSIGERDGETFTISATVDGTESSFSGFLWSKDYAEQRSDHLSHTTQFTLSSTAGGGDYRQTAMAFFDALDSAAYPVSVVHEAGAGEVFSLTGLGVYSARLLNVKTNVETNVVSRPQQDYVVGSLDGTTATLFRYNDSGFQGKFSVDNVKDLANQPSFCAVLLTSGELYVYKAAAEGSSSPVLVNSRCGSMLAINDVVIGLQQGSGSISIFNSQDQDSPRIEVLENVAEVRIVSNMFLIVKTDETMSVTTNGYDFQSIILPNPVSSGISSTISSSLSGPIVNAVVDGQQSAVAWITGTAVGSPIVERVHSVSGADYSDIVCFLRDFDVVVWKGYPIEQNVMDYAPEVLYDRRYTDIRPKKGESLATIMRKVSKGGILRRDIVTSEDYVIYNIDDEIMSTPILMLRRFSELKPRIKWYPFQVFKEQ